MLRKERKLNRWKKFLFALRYKLCYNNLYEQDNPQN